MKDFLTVPALRVSSSEVNSYGAKWLYYSPRQLSGYGVTVFRITSRAPSRADSLRYWPQGFVESVDSSHDFTYSEVHYTLALPTKSMETAMANKQENVIFRMNGRERSLSEPSRNVYCGNYFRDRSRKTDLDYERGKDRLAHWIGSWGYEEVRDTSFR